ALARYGKRISVLEAEAAEQANAIGVLQPLRDLLEHLFTRLHVTVVHLVGPEGAGVVNISVDIAGGQRLEDDRGTEPITPLGGKTICGQTLLHQRAQDVLLGERFGADHIAAACAAKTRRESGQ